MRVLHTSDWHIGADLCEKSRLDEHKAFFAWLANTIREERVNVLLASGDIFDTPSPSNGAVAVYFDFLRSLHDTPCRHVVITGGNHDSPSHLNAPAGYLAHDGIHILGCAKDGAIEREVLVLDDEKGAPSLIVCAVPFLRDRDVRKSSFGQNPEERARELCAGIDRHYRDVLARAGEIAQGLSSMKALFGRSRVVREGSLTVIEDCYNASLDSVSDAIATLSNVHWNKNKHIVLGDMKELGSASRYAHRTVGRMLCSADCQYIYLYGSEMEEAYKVLYDNGQKEKAVYTPDFEVLSSSIRKETSHGDLFLLKGSRSMAMERLFDTFKEVG